MSKQSEAPIEPVSLPPEQDITEAERDALLLETLRSLQDAFSAPNDEDDTGTVTQLNQNPAEAVPDNPELPL